MTITEVIIQHLKTLPESAQAEVLDLVEYLESKVETDKHTQDETDWSALSLSQAMRGMENEQTSYSIKDIKEIFS